LVDEPTGDFRRAVRADEQLRQHDSRKFDYGHRPLHVDQWPGCFQHVSFPGGIHQFGQRHLRFAGYYFYHSRSTAVHFFAGPRIRIAFRAGWSVDRHQCDVDIANRHSGDGNTKRIRLARGRVRLIYKWVMPADVYQRFDHKYRHFDTGGDV